MSDVIAYTDPVTGKLCTITPAPGVPVENEVRFVPEGVAYSIIDSDALPPTREFRAAWKLTIAGPTIDLDRAKEVTKERLRAERAPLLEQLDAEVMRAAESARPTDELVAEKQRLRDITNLADQAQSLDELRALRARRETK